MNCTLCILCKKFFPTRSVIHSLKVKVKLLSHVQLFVTPWTVAYQAPQSMEFSRQEYWSVLPFPFPWHLPDPGSNPGVPHCEQMLYHLSHQGSPRGNGLVRDLFSSKWFKALSSKFKQLINLELVFVFSGALHCVHAQSCLTLCNPMDCSPPDSTVHGTFPGKDTGVSCLFLLQEVFMTQRLNPCLLHWQVGSLLLCHLGSPVLFSRSVVADSL